MDAHDDKKAESDKPGFFNQYFRALRFYFITGLLVWVPLIVTLWVAWWLFKTVGLGLEGLIQRGYDLLHDIGNRVPQLEFLTSITYVRGFGFLIALALFLTTGFLTRSIVTRRLISAVERILDQLRQTPHTRLPVYRRDLGQMVGLLHMRRIAQELAKDALDRDRLEEIAVRIMIRPVPLALEAGENRIVAERLLTEAELLEARIADHQIAQIGRAHV